MNRSILLTVAALVLAAVSFTAYSAESRTTQSFDAGWKFNRFGPMPDGSTTAEPAGLESPALNDTSWRSVNLPHDWGIEGPFRPELPNNTGKLPWAGIGWYRKSFTLDAADQGHRIFLDFDGAMSHPKVYVNGQLAGEWAYGYSSFRVEITDFVKFGPANVVAVRLDNPAASSRWYPGSGIYRHVRLEKTAPVHVAHWGVFVHTPKVSRDSAEVVVETTVDNQSAAAAQVSVRHFIFAPKRKTPVASFETKAAGVNAGANGKLVATATVNRPELWDVTSPGVYTLHTTVLVDGKPVDNLETRFGIRKIEWSAEKGFLLNDRVLRLQGVCNHHDLGALGAAFNERAAERQLEILREMGCSAIRTSHNPPAPQLLDLCDRMGFVVMDELFDCWKLGKTPGDYSKDFDAWHERDVVNLVRRDRNHPSVILWSSGNEIREQQGKPEDLERSRRLTGLFHREDPTRKVSNGMNNHNAIVNGFAQTLDVAGYNYKAILAKKPNYLDHVRHAPNQPFFGAETASTVSSRGVYFFPVNPKKDGGFFQFQVSSYDLYAPPWANIPDQDFDSIDHLPALAGEFVWTGFDYLGEPTPYNKDDSNLLNFQSEAERAAMLAEMQRLGGAVPSRSSYFGIIDLAGFPKDRYYLYQSRWRPDLKMAHILPHWNWAGREGQVTPVHVYTSGDEAELFLNGKSLGRKKKAEREYRLRWNDVVYQPGELKVVAYRGGKRWAEATRRTTGAVAGLKLEADRREIRADGSDLSFITVRVVDSKGEMVPTANELVKFTVTGPADIAGVDNGDATSWLPFQGSEMKSFNGLCLVILRSRAGQSGPVELQATSGQLPVAKIRITTGK
jgi:beta-galactosidase